MPGPSGIENSVPFLLYQILCSSIHSPSIVPVIGIESNGIESSTLSRGWSRWQSHKGIGVCPNRIGIIGYLVKKRFESYRYRVALTSSHKIIEFELILSHSQLSHLAARSAKFVPPKSTHFNPARPILLQSAAMFRFLNRSSV